MNVTISLPPELVAEARAHKLPISALCARALERALVEVNRAERDKLPMWVVQAILR